MAEAEGGVVYCQIEECGQLIARNLWEDHLLAHELQAEPIEVPQILVTLEESASVPEEVLQETMANPSRSSCQIQKENNSEFREQTDNAKQLQSETNMATFTSAANDGDDAECKICNQSIRIADISDHMIAHEFESLEEEEQPTDGNSESDLNETHATAVYAAGPDSKELKHELAEFAGSMKKDIGSLKVGEVVKGVSEVNREELMEEVVEGVSSVGEVIQQGWKELKSDTEDGVTIGELCEVGFGFAKAATGYAKELWDERKAKKQALKKEMATLSPAMAAVSIASETLVHHISRLVRDLNIPEDWLDQMCSDEHILEIARYMTDWKHIAHELRLKETDIEEIEMERTVTMQRLKVLEKWKQRFYSHATYRKLLEVFFKIERLDYAYKLGRLLQCSLLPDTSSYARQLQ